MVSRTVQLTTLVLLSLVAILVPVGYGAYQVYRVLLGESNPFMQIDAMLPPALLRAMLITVFSPVTDDRDSVFQVIGLIVVVWSLVVLGLTLSVLFIRRQLTKESATHNTR